VPAKVETAKVAAAKVAAAKVAAAKVAAANMATAKADMPTPTTAGEMRTANRPATKATAASTMESATISTPAVPGAV
jgi:hypothetical protein